MFTILESGRTGGAQLSKIEGLSSPKKGVTSNRHVVQLGKTSGWKESYFANEHSKWILSFILMSLNSCFKFPYTLLPVVGKYIGKN